MHDGELSSLFVRLERNPGTWWGILSAFQESGASMFAIL